MKLEDFHTLSKELLNEYVVNPMVLPEYCCEVLKYVDFVRSIKALIDLDKPISANVLQSCVDELQKD